MSGINSLFHFVNLARTAWDEAAEIYAADSFATLLNKDSKALNIYKGLGVAGDINQSLEEFLIAIDKKEPQSFFVEKNIHKGVYSISFPMSGSEHSLEIRRDSWGYCNLAIGSRGDFIELKKERLYEEDFRNGIANLPFEINSEKLHNGRNFGRILIKYLNNIISVEIVVNCRESLQRNLMRQRNKSNRLRLTRHYLDMMMRKIEKKRWIELSESLLEQLLSADVSNLAYNLSHAHILIEDGRYNEAKWIIDKRVIDYINDSRDEEYAYYQYVLSRYTSDNIYGEESAGRLLAMFERDYSNWYVGFCLYKINQRLGKDNYSQYRLLKLILDNGCISPIVYIEVIWLISIQPDLLVSLEESIKRVLLFGAKNGLIDGMLLRLVAHHGAREREYDPRTFKILSLLYEKEESRDVLQAICICLMRGYKKGPKYLKWYEAAINSDFTLSRLYESYMNSLELDKSYDIPRPVLLYFAYENNLSNNEKAFLYRHIYELRDREEDIYRAYKYELERFTLSELYALHIDENLAYLYRELILKNMATMDNLRQLGKLLGSVKIKVEAEDIRCVIIRDLRLSKEIIAELTNMQAILRIPGGDSLILLEDYKGNRYINGKDYTLTDIPNSAEILPKVQALTEDELISDLYICDRLGAGIDEIKVNEDNVFRLLYLYRDPGISDEYKEKIRMPLLEYLYEKEDNFHLKELLLEAESFFLPVKDEISGEIRQGEENPSLDRVLDILINLDMTELAFHIALRQDMEYIDSKVVLKLCSRLIEYTGGQIKNAFLLEACNILLKKNLYNEIVLKYLMQFCEDDVEALNNIRKLASSFCLETHSLSERILYKSLKEETYLEDISEVIRDYVAGGAKSGLLIDYVKLLCHKSLMEETPIEPYLYVEIMNIYDEEGELPTECMLAFLQYMSLKGDPKDFSNREKSHVRRYIHILFGINRIALPFMGSFKDISMESNQIANRTIVVYRGREDINVCINYTLLEEGNMIMPLLKEGTRDGEIRERMDHVYGGIYAKSFLLFYGDRLNYYITETLGNMEEIKKQGEIESKISPEKSVTDRFGLINEALILRARGDEKNALLLINKYKYQEHLVENLFHIQ